VRLDVATGRPVIESTATLDDLVTDGPIADLTAKGSTRPSATTSARCGT
jgi:hypothetical protein